MMPARTRGVDYLLYFATMILVIAGVVAVFSASYANYATAAQTSWQESETRTSSQELIAKSVSQQQRGMVRQSLWVVAGSLVLLGCYLLNLDLLRQEWFRRAAYWVAVVALTLCLVPGIGSTMGRASRRWIELGPVSVQPSEFAKIVLVLVLAGMLTSARTNVRTVGGLIKTCLAAGVPMVLVLVETHLGATLVMGAVTAVMLFLGGARGKHLLVIVLVGAVVVTGSLSVMKYQQRRVVTWLNPMSDPDGDGYQAIHCAAAMGRGGLTGRGLGRSIEKFTYLPECDSDSVLAVVGEEVGLFGTGGLLLLFTIYGWRGFRIASQAKDPFLRLLAAGLTLLVVVQSMVNFGVTTGLLPQTGVGLPFISKGGSALLAFMAATGLLLNLSNQVERRDAGGQPRAR